MSTPVEGRHYELYVASDSVVCKTVAADLRQWGEGRDVTIDIVPVLSRPRDVVRMQIFYAPALVVDGRLVAGGIESREDLARFLPD